MRAIRKICGVLCLAIPIAGVFALVTAVAGPVKAALFVATGIAGAAIGIGCAWIGTKLLCK